MSTFSKNLRFLRKRGNHNQDEIALLFRKRANTIGNWENQKSEPNLTELMKLGEFFRVSVEDLLHTDMEKHADSTGSGSSISPLPANPDRVPVTSPKVQESSLAVREGGPDAFWLILRELRVIGEKLDVLVSGTDTGGFKKKSDKSYH
jgi:transcriptional regulator with XRE-family HTH domain